MDQIVAPPLPTTPDEFLARKALQEHRFEFGGRTARPLNGGSAAHARIERNIVWERVNRRAGTSAKRSAAR